MAREDLGGPHPDRSLELPGLEDEILDRQAGIDGWTFSCCMSIDDEDAPKRVLAPAQRPLSRPALDDEILDRAWHADGFYTICCTMGISPEDGDVRSAIARPRPTLDDEILDRTWHADGFYTICCTMGITSEDGKVRPPIARAHQESVGSDPMVDTMLLAGASLLGGTAQPTPAPTSL